MEDNELNALLQEVRNCLMPTQNIEDMFNLTFDVERPEYTTDKIGGFTTSWHEVDSNQRGALDDGCQQAQFKREGGPQLVESIQSALYCKGNVNIQRLDKVTLRVDKQDKTLVFEVKAVRNPMMRYRYLVVLCEPER
jgi:hypothetical protein